MTDIFQRRPGTNVGERILVLDDEASILEVLLELLQEVSYECVTTTSAHEALELLEKEKFSLLITDLKMPEMHGIEVVKRAKAHDKDLAVIVVTALLEVTNAIDAMRSGADDYLLKPFNLTEITLSVDKALDRRRLIIENRRHQNELETRVEDATKDLKSINVELQETKDYLENLLDSSIDAIMTTNETGTITFCNDGASKMLGYSQGEFVGQDVVKFFTGDAEEVNYLRRMLKSDKPVQNYETELIHKNGDLLNVNMSISLVKNTSGAVVSILAICKDITDQKRLESELKELSIKDSLSGLYNQRYFYERIEAELDRAARQGRPLSLLMIDVDDFKPYNDRHGHLEGDRVLKAVGQVVEECTREHVDIGFRYGGDEFTVVLPEAAEPQALRIAERIRTLFRERRFDILTLSIGLMSYVKGMSMKAFIRAADSMMYEAKRSGGNRVRVHHPKDAEPTVVVTDPEDDSAP